MKRREAIAWAVGLIGVLAAVAAPGLRAEAQDATGLEFRVGLLELRADDLDLRVSELERGALPPAVPAPPFTAVPPPPDPAVTVVFDCRLSASGASTLAQPAGRYLLGCVRYTGYPTAP